MNMKTAIRHILGCWAGWLVVLLAVLGVLPFVLLSLYAHPSADDWYMAADTLDKGFWKSNVDFYFGLTGRFFSSALLFMNPILLSMDAFKFYSMGLVLGLVASAHWAVGAWFPRTSELWRWLLAIMMSVMFFWSMASPAQGLYWGTGSAGYTVPGITSLCLAALLGVRSLDDPHWRPSGLRLVGVALLALATTGCTEVAMAMLFVHVVALNGMFLRFQRKLSPPLLVLLVATLIGVAIVVLAPGNAVREAWYQNDVHHRLVPSLLMALKLGLKQIAVWLAYAPIFLFSLVALTVWPAMPRVSLRHGWEMVAVSSALIVCTVVGGFFLGTWSMGAVIPLRAVNLVLLFFIVDWLVLLAGVVTLLRCYEVEIPRAGAFLSACAFCIFCAGMLSSNNNLKTAWQDLVSGSAAQYGRESTLRYAMIRSSDQPNVMLPALRARPRSLFFNDLTTDPTNWRNVGCSRFFQKGSVALLP